MLRIVYSLSERDYSMDNKKLHGLELSLTIGCQLDCAYCPQRLLLSKYYQKDKNRKTKLDFEDFKTVLEKVQPGSTLSFCGMSEPFHNERCADMIAYAAKMGYKICLNTTLVGMSHLDFEKIKDIKFENFILHIPDQEGHSKFVITKEYLNLLEVVNKNIKIDYYSCHGTVHEAVKDIIDKNKYAGINLGDRAGNLDLNNYHKEVLKGEIICYNGSEEQIGGWMPVMLPDGSLILCCQDYGMKHVLGNLIVQSWDEICKGDVYTNFKNGLKDDSIDILCRKCGSAKLKDSLPAMQLRKAINDRKVEKEEDEVLSEEAGDMLKRFGVAESVCVFGLGKLWRDHYYQECWDEGLGTTIFSDNNPELHGQYVNGVECVAPNTLRKYKNLLVILFVKNSDGIISQLRQSGIDNYIVIDEVVRVCRGLCKENFLNMTKQNECG